MRKRLIPAMFGALVTTVILVGILIGGHINGVDGALLSYRTIDYTAVATADGDLRVTEHLDYKLKAREDEDGHTKRWKQLYWQYTLDPNKLTDITDISVRNATTGETYTRTDPQNPDAINDGTWDIRYANHWYIADVTRGADDPQPYEPGESGLDTAYGTTKTIELGWNIPATKETDSLRFDVSFTMHDVATKHPDITTFQWEPIAASNQVPAGTVTGVVTFPKGVDATGAWSWLHTENTSETNTDAEGRTGDGTLRFTVHDLKVGGYINVVAAYDSKYAGAVKRTAAGDELGRLKADEKAKERNWRDQQRGVARTRLATWAGLALGAIALIAWALIAVFRTRRLSGYHGSLEYWRDPPGVSPACAARLIDTVSEPPTGKAGQADNRALAATVMALAVKKAIAIYPGPAGMYRGIDMSRADAVGISRMIGADPYKIEALRSTSTIVILPAAFGAERSSLGLCQSEAACLDLLIDISYRVGCPVFDFEQMGAACKKWKEGYKSLGRFATAAKNELALLGATKPLTARYAVPGVILIILGTTLLTTSSLTSNIAVQLCVGAPTFFAGLFALLAGAPLMLTAYGQDLGGRCLGLKRYMEDFSDFTDRGTADLALWDWYMVYAAAFGISRRAVSELAKAYPQVTDPDWLDANGSDSIWYWSYRPYRWHHHYGGSGSYGSSGPSVDTTGFDGGAGPGDFIFGGDSFAAGLGDIGSQLSSGFASVSSTISAASPSSGGGGGFGGGGGGSGGGSSGGR
ncbi:DUF2207 domain-containing protein [Bifidobacterium platyrrhinorum]|uniref:DUF2207 domain-containing protein n=1 Tax=Bifidobacterium platyrrhinorum TaxID=2661628 RepID=A0A6L9SS30_9BIFI|nr:DUF2207 domain-containing protein [Bifidobacterium platyrrhinorum]NEG54985.1 DUF2207 domain-containing protein [Bifidobacterium platyrrhinorum]